MASYADAAIPAGFCTELTAAWRRHHAKKRGEGGNADELEAAQTGPFHGRTTLQGNLQRATSNLQLGYKATS